MIAGAKSDFESCLALNYVHTNNNKIFHYISSIKGHDNFPAKMCYNDECASTDINKAQLSNRYFYSVFSLSHAPISVPESQPSNQIFNDIQFTNADVFELHLLMSAKHAALIT